MTINREVARIASRTNKIDRNHIYPLVMNGDMRIAQRGTTTTGHGGDSTYGAIDRWRMSGNSNTAGRFTQSQSTDVPTGQGFKHSMKWDCTTADTSIAANEFMQMYQSFEGRNCILFNKGTADCTTWTVVFWAKGTAATYACELYDSENDRQVSKLFTITTSWQKFVLNFPADTSTSDDITYDDAGRFNFQFQFHAGSNFTSGTINDSAWADRTDANRFPGISSFFSSTDNELYITGCQLELGTFVEGSEPEFQFVDHATQLKQCQRYYQMIINGDDQFIGNGHFHADDYLFVPAHMKATMRGTPTAEVTTATSYWAFEGGNNIGDFDNIDGVAHQSHKGCLFYTDGDGVNAVDPYTTNNTCKVRSNHANARLALSADL